MHSTINIAHSLLEGHHRFLLRNTNDTVNPTTDHYVLNNQGVLANNRHFINNTRMQYQPNGDGTSEGQVIHILGYCYAYIATKEVKYLDTAIIHWDAYVQHFYAGQPIPSIPKRWIANWIVNAKEPVLANYPVNASVPAKGGFKAVPVTFTDGLAKLPPGAPTWGEYLDVATFAFDGVLGWDSINAAVYVDDGAGNPVWGTPGIKYDVDWIITWSGEKVDWDGDVLSTGHLVSEHGSIKLKNTTVNGVKKFNYATRNPVEHGGYLIKRNEVQHNRPLHTPLLGSVNQMSNAADAEEWFSDACYLLWRITDDIKYKNAFDSSIYTLNEFVEFSQFSGLTKYFEQSQYINDPFTSGNSYSYSYPSDTSVSYDRDSDGYITILTSKACKHYLEHDDITKTVSDTSGISVTVGGVGLTNKSVSYVVTLYANEIDSDTGISVYTAPLPSTTLLEPNTTLLPMSMFVKESPDSIMASTGIVSDYGGLVYNDQYETGILTNKEGTTVTGLFPNDDAGMIIGFWGTSSGRSVLNSIVYKSDGEFNLRIIDADGWRWYWLLPNTLGQWITYVCDPADLYLSGYQPDHPTDPDPSAPNYVDFDQLSILLENSGDTNLSFTFYCINEPPSVFNIQNKYLRSFRLTIACDEAFNAKVGDCYLTNPAGIVPLAYVPGLMPFSNLYEDNGDIDSTNGLPYPGYQYPFIFSVDPVRDIIKLNNMIDFMYDAQLWYSNKFGILGPVASAYILDIPSNTDYGPANTFTMYHWGDGEAWSGYQPRTFQGGARALQQLHDQGVTPPTKLHSFVNNWINWLISFYDTHGILPTHYPSESIPVPVNNDFTGHMTGLYLAGACMAYLAGIDTNNNIRLMDACFKELTENYINTGVPNHAMDGSWSPHISTTDDNSMFFGFWSGEVMRGIALYVICKSNPPGTNILD